MILHRISGRLAAVVVGAACLGAAVSAPANAALIAPNGLFNYSLPGPNTVNTTNITAATTSLVLGNNFPGPLITSFLDPFRGKVNNFCLMAGAGCTAAHSPGFLEKGSFAGLSELSLPVGNKSPVAIAETVTAQTNFGGAVDVDFDFTKIFTAGLVPTTSTSAGSLTLDFSGTFASDSTNRYALGQSAEMAIKCTQPGLGRAITCSGTVSTPPGIGLPAVPEPTSLALLSSAVLGFGIFRRRRAA